MVPLENLLAEADIISLHFTYGADTHHLLDKEKLARTETRCGNDKYGPRGPYR